MSPKGCATKCKEQEGCKYFSVGNNGGFENCKWEKTTDSSCPEGWDADSYDFYELQGNFYYTNIYMYQRYSQN